MKICVVGWYLYRPLYAQLQITHQSHSVFVVSHRGFNCLPEGYTDFVFASPFRNLPHQIIPNVGIEWGAYNHYLKNIWDRKSDVLFMHDDTYIGDLSVFDRIAKITHDCAYIFRDNAEDQANGGKHGRAIFMSRKFLTHCLNTTCVCPKSYDREDPHNKGSVLIGTGPHNGFWFDPNNNGHISGKPPIGTYHYNESIYHFHWFLGKTRDRKFGNEPMDVVNRVYFPEFEAGRRGTWRHKENEQKRYATTPA